MRKVFNFICPCEDLIHKINIHKFTNALNIAYIVSDVPLKYADMLFLSVSQLSKCFIYSEFKFIPFIVYGDVDFIEKSFIAGSCDFLKEPWSFNELEARASRYKNKEQIFVNNTEISFSNKCMKSENLSIPISVAEYTILSILTNNTDRIISRESIYYRLGISNSGSRVIDVYINLLRKKINTIAMNNDDKVIQTVRGKGYTINSQFTCG